MQMKIPGTFPDAERFNYIVINFLLCLFLLFAHFYLTECVISIYSMNLPKLSLTPQIFPGFINLLLIYNGLLSLNTPLLKKKMWFLPLQMWFLTLGTQSYVYPPKMWFLPLHVHSTLEMKGENIRSDL